MPIGHHFPASCTVPSFSGAGVAGDCGNSGLGPCVRAICSTSGSGRMFLAVRGACDMWISWLVAHACVEV
eukprot:7278998-Alexandrium_andersonii.AAC.1